MSKRPPTLTEKFRALDADLTAHGKRLKQTNEQLADLARRVNEAHARHKAERMAEGLIRAAAPKMTPAIHGGQGRSARDVKGGALVLLWVMGAALAAFGVLWIIDLFV